MTEQEENDRWKDQLYEAAILVTITNDESKIYHPNSRIIIDCIPELTEIAKNIQLIRDKLDIRVEPNSIISKKLI